MGCRWRLVIGGAVAVVAAIIAAVGTLIVPNYIRKSIDDQTWLGYDQCGNYTETTNKWIEPQYNFSLNIWTFSVQNPYDVIKNSSAKPILIEKGPYVFREHQKKSVNFVNNNTRVLYRNHRYYYFDQQHSCSYCSLRDQIVIPNIVLQTLLDGAKDSAALRIALSALMKESSEHVFIQTTVGDLLFNGYQDPLITKLCNHPLVRAVCKAFGIPDRIGLFYNKNGTDDGLYEVNTGAPDLQYIGKIYSFNNKQTVPAWYGAYAKMVNGTDGQLYQPGLDLRDSSKIKIFVGQICRTIEMEYYDTTNYEGVTLYLYRPSAEMNDVDVQRQLGFCNPNTPRYFNNSYVQQEGCTPSGVMDVSSCLPGKPRIYISQPHFYGSNPALRDVLSGIKNPSELDNTVIGIEPKTGVVVMAMQRSQLNLGVTSGNLAVLGNLTSRIIPIVWFNETAHFDADTRDLLLYMGKAFSIVRIVNILTYAVMSVSLVFLVIDVTRRYGVVHSDEAPLIERVDEEEVAEESVHNHED